MPYQIFKNGGKEKPFCVYKHDENGKPTGDSLGCHPSHKQAAEQMRAIYAHENMAKETIQEFNVGEFRGSFPDVPIADGVNMDELKELDANPFYVTLPIVPEVGAISKNGLLYDEALVSSVEKQINEKRPGGIFGHLKDEERNTAFPIPSGMWVGAQRVGQTLWAKCYVPPGATRDHMRTLKAVGGNIATSIYGKGDFEKVREGVRRLTNFNLESLDFAPPERAALGYGATPILTAELEQDPEQGKDTDMDKSQVLAELTVSEIPQSLREQIVREAQEPVNARVQELESALAAGQTKTAALETAVAEFQTREFERTLDARVAELVNWQVRSEEAKKKIEAFKKSLRSQIVNAVGAERDPQKVSEIIASVWEDIKPIAETVRDALAGPAAIVAGKVRGDNKRTLDMSPEAIQASVAKFNVTV